MSQIVFPQGDATVTVPAGSSIAVASRAEAQVFEVVGFPQYPSVSDLLGVVSDLTITVFTFGGSAATISLQAGATEMYYNVGVAPTIPELIGGRKAVDVVDIDTTAAATPAAMISGMIGGVIASTTAAPGVTLQVPTGAFMEAAFELSDGDAINWTVINDGVNTATVTAAASGHTVGGAGAVATNTSGYFQTIKLSASTFVTVRLA
jgi:hypothetical protein